MRPLVALAARRTLGPGLALAGLALLLVAARAGTGDGGLAADLAHDDGAGARALARQNVWSVLLVLTPILLVRAARQGSSGALAWLAPAAAGRRAPASAVALGALLAASLACAATAAVAEGSVDGGADAWRSVRAPTGPTHVLPEGAPPVHWAAGTLARPGRVRVTVTVAPGSGPAVAARVVVRETAGDDRVVEHERVLRVSGRTHVDVDVGAGSAVTLELSRTGPGALLVAPPDALQVLERVADERVAGLVLLARAWLLVCAAVGLALGLGRHLNPALAAGLVVALGVAEGRAGLPPGPVTALARAWNELSAGLVPAWPTGGEWVCAGTLVLAGLVLHAAAPRRFA